MKILNRPERGFDCLIGETIVKVDATAINVVSFETASGKKVDVDCDEQHYRIGVIQAKLRVKKEK